MKYNALAVANYFVELANKEGKPLTLLGLIKRVYIAHGFSMAVFDCPLLDSRFDKVEAWKYGPVIPSVYHSFKQYKSSPITEKTIIMAWDEIKDEPIFKTPELTDDNAKNIVEMVWKRYHEYSDSELVALTHRKGTPWELCYVQGENLPIPDSFTKLYYQKLINNLLESMGKTWAK